LVTEGAAQLRVLFDASRLVTRGGAAATGIDRVDLAYARALAASPDIDFRMLVFDLLGPRLLSRQSAAALLDATVQRWQSEADNYVSQRAFEQIVEWLNAAPGAPRPSLPQPPARLRHTSPFNKARKALETLLHSTFLRRVPNGLPKSNRLKEAAAIPTVYLNTSHGRLYRKSVLRWLDKTRIPAVFFVHDLIPIEYPQFNRPREPARHAARLATISRYATHVLVNSEVTRESLAQYLCARRMRTPPVSVLPLGVDQRFRNTIMAPEISTPYFVMLSTIEPRKNHYLLLRIWQKWIAAEGHSAPRWVILGRRGWQNETVFALLDETGSLNTHVLECGALSDAQVGSLMRGARALLSPSFAEGFGLPVAEALAAGTPVIVSDIAAHREVGGDFAEYLDPDDESGWLQILREYAHQSSARREARVAALEDYRSPQWQDHLSRAIDVLSASATQAPQYPICGGIVKLAGS